MPLVLKHYGVKGMRWGIRRDRDTTPTAVDVKTAPGKKVSASGGKNQPASEDAIKTAKIRQQAKASTTDSLSNQELQALVTRMNLEQQYSRITAIPQSPAKKFVRSLLGDLAKENAGAYLETQGAQYAPIARALDPQGTARREKARKAAANANN